MYITEELFDLTENATTSSLHSLLQTCTHDAMNPEPRHSPPTLGKRKRFGGDTTVNPSSLSRVVPNGLDTYPCLSTRADASFSLNDDKSPSSGESYEDIYSEAAISSRRAASKGCSLAGTATGQQVFYTNHLQDGPPPSKCRRKILPLKQNAQKYQRPTVESPNQSPPRNADNGDILKPCHLCFKKPTQRKDLDSFANCSLCTERTCYVCIRSCAGNCKEKRICRHCCVEQGEEGDTWCLACLQRPDQEMEG